MLGCFQDSEENLTVVFSIDNRTVDVSRTAECLKKHRGALRLVGWEALPPEGWRLERKRAHVSRIQSLPTMVQLVTVPLRTGKNCPSSDSSRLKIVIMGLQLSVGITASPGIFYRVVKSITVFQKEVSQSYMGPLLTFCSGS